MSNDSKQQPERAALYDAEAWDGAMEALERARIRAEEAEAERDRLRAALAEAERERDALRERVKRMEGALRRVLRRHGHSNADTVCAACGDAHAALSPPAKAP